MLDPLPLVLSARGSGHRIMFIGNGGSAAIAIHCAADWMKAAHFKTLEFCNPASLTCLANDLGYDQVYSIPIAIHGEPGDILVAISSSGQSINILNAVRAARSKDMHVITVSGFKPDNPLRAMGDINHYTDSSEYGTVEIDALVYLHGILDQVLKP